MSDNNNNEKRQRPNANYRLSKENADLGSMVFHYNRERRLAKAPEAVQNLYNSEPPKMRFGIFGPLIRTKPMMMMFLSIVLICLAVMVVSAFGLIGSSFTLDGNQVSIQAIKYDGAVIVVLKKSPRQGVFSGVFSNAAPYTGAVDIAVQPSIKATGVQPEGTFFHRVFFTLEPTEYYRFSIPFDAEELAFVLATEKRTLRAMIRPE